MKKLLLTLSLISLNFHTHIHAYDDAVLSYAPASFDTQKNAIVELMEGPHLWIHHLGKNDRNKALILTAFCYIYTAIATSPAYINRYSDHFETSVALQATVAFLSTAAGITYLLMAPHFHWSQEERNILDLVITHANEKELLIALHEYFASYSKETKTAFDKLSSLSTRLTRAKEILVHSKNDRYKELIVILTINIAAVNKALVLVKNQPAWTEQQSSSAVSYSIQSQDNTTQAQLLVR